MGTKCDGDGAAKIRQGRDWSVDNFDTIEIRHSLSTKLDCDGSNGRICFEHVESCASSWNASAGHARLVHWRCWRYDSTWWSQWSWHPPQPPLAILSASYLRMFCCYSCSFTILTVFFYSVQHCMQVRCTVYYHDGVFICLAFLSPQWVGTDGAFAPLHIRKWIQKS